MKADQTLKLEIQHALNYSIFLFWTERLLMTITNLKSFQLQPAAELRWFREKIWYLLVYHVLKRQFIVVVKYDCRFEVDSPSVQQFFFWTPKLHVIFYWEYKLKSPHYVIQSVDLLDCWGVVYEVIFTDNLARNFTLNE